MIRISEIKLPLSALPADEGTHPEAALRAAVAGILRVDEASIARLQIHKRSFDARKAELVAVYIVDVAFTDTTHEATLLTQFSGHPHIAPTPDMEWQPPVHVAAPPAIRPVVVGFGPCGI